MKNEGMAEPATPIQFCVYLYPVSSNGDENIMFLAKPLRSECNTGMKKVGDDDQKK
jgi:hypothetical protein